MLSQKYSIVQELLNAHFLQIKSANILPDEKDTNRCFL